MPDPARAAGSTSLLVVARASSLAALRDRLLLAATGTLAAGCGESTPPTTPQPHDTAPPSAVSEAVATETSGPTSSALAQASAAPSAPRAPSTPETAQSSAPMAPSPPLALGPGCFAPKTVMRSVGTGEPGPAPPPSSYDAHGCLPSSMVSNTCCMGAIAGPRFVGGACCYSFPKRDACCGRPFRVEGEARVAPVRPGHGWLSPSPARESDSLFTMPRSARDDLAQGWLRDAQLEHASVASFARFVLDLISLGAPAEFVQAAGAAMLDEIEHARLCFGLVARFSGEERSPGPFAAAAAPEERSFEDIVRGAVIEGCVGETAAAHVAAVRLEAATDPEVRRVLTRIAEDEARHAELAFRFVAWVIRQRGEAARACVERAFAEVDGPNAPSCDVTARAASTWRPAFGLLDDEAAQIATRTAIERIARPAARVLHALNA